MNTIYIFELTDAATAARLPQLLPGMRERALPRHSDHGHVLYSSSVGIPVPRLYHAPPAQTVQRVRHDPPGSRPDRSGSKPVFDFRRCYGTRGWRAEATDANIAEHLHHGNGILDTYRPTGVGIRCEE